MQKPLTLLLKLRKRTLEERRSQLATLVEQHLQLCQEQQHLIDTFQKEQEIASSFTEARISYSTFLAHYQSQQRELNARRLQLEQEITTLQEAIVESFTEVKRYEIALETYEKEQALKERKREEAQMDEATLNRFHRSQSSS